MKTILAYSLAAALTVAPAVALAETYHYIDITGEVESIEAQSAAEALMVIEANGDALHSGVKLDVGQLEEGEDYGITYEYQSTSGGTGRVTAASADAAMLLATDIVPGTLVAVEVSTGDNDEE
jgi:hypothetical protein